MVDLTIRAFETAERYRMPAMLLADGMLGQMMEPVTFPDEVPLPSDKPWALTGTKEQRNPNIVNSLYLTPSQLEAIVKDRFKRYELVKAREVLFEEYRMDGAEIVLVAYGATARICKAAVDAARADGIPAGLFRPVTLWPFPEKELAAVSEKAGQMLVVEMSMGQMGRRRAAGGKRPLPGFLLRPDRRDDPVPRRNRGGNPETGQRERGGLK